MNSFEFRIAQNRSSSDRPTSLLVVSLLSIRRASSGVGLRPRQRTYNSSTTAIGGFFSASSRETTLPCTIFPVVVSPLRRCSAWESVGDVFTSQVQGESRDERPNVVRK